MFEIWAKRLGSLADLLWDNYNRESLCPIISGLPKTIKLIKTKLKQVYQNTVTWQVDMGLTDSPHPLSCPILLILRKTAKVVLQYPGDVSSSLSSSSSYKESPEACPRSPQFYCSPGSYTRIPGFLWKPVEAVSRIWHSRFHSSGKCHPNHNDYHSM